MADTDDVLFAREGAIGVVTLNRPEQRNPVTNPAIIEGLVAALARASEDREVRVVILTAAGPAFSAGGNVKAMAAALDQPYESPTRAMGALRQGVQRIPFAFQELEVPVIAAVNGPAVGAGCDLACMCDIRIASDNATFAESFARMGLVSGDGGSWLLQRIVGFSAAAEMAFTCDAIDAAEALRIGLVSRVVPPEQLMPTAMQVAERIARNPGDAVRMTRRLMVQAREQTLATALEAARAMQALALKTPEHRDAVLAFVNKPARPSAPAAPTGRTVRP